MGKNKSKKLKNVAVKGTIVNDKDGSHFRSSYQRKMLVNVDEVPLKKNNSKQNINDKDISESKPLGDEESGISSNVQLVTFKDGSTGYFKPVTGEPFVSKVSSPQDQPNLNFNSYHLNNKNGEKLSIEEHGDYQKKPNSGRGEVKGQMIDREVLTYAIGKALKMDHLPETNIKEINGTYGSIAENLHEKHKNDDVDFINKYEVTGGDAAFAEIAKTDKKAGDKALFDFIVGNADRHGGNFLHKKLKSGTSEMLAFDHGFTFPSSNSIYQFMDYYNQEKFDNAMKDVQFTEQMVENVKNFVNGQEYKNIVSMIENKIGKKEAGAFKERISLVYDKIVNNGAKTTNAVGYRKEKFMT